MTACSDTVSLIARLPDRLTCMNRLLIRFGPGELAPRSAASNSTGDVPGPFSTELASRTLKCTSPASPRQPISP